MMKIQFLCVVHAVTIIIFGVIGLISILMMPKFSEATSNELMTYYAIGSVMISLLACAPMKAFQLGMQAQERWIHENYTLIRKIETRKEENDGRNI